MTTNRSERSAGSSVGIAMMTLLVTTSRGNVRANAKMAGLAAFAMKVSKFKKKERLKNTNKGVLNDDTVSLLLKTHGYSYAVLH